MTTQSILIVICINEKKQTWQHTLNHHTFITGVVVVGLGGYYNNIWGDNKSIHL